MDVRAKFHATIWRTKCRAVVANSETNSSSAKIAGSFFVPSVAAASRNPKAGPIDSTKYTNGSVPGAGFDNVVERDRQHCVPIRRQDAESR